MKKLIGFMFIALLLVSASASLTSVSAQSFQVKRIWSIPVATNDVAVSKDGNYVAAVNDSGLYYFQENSPSPNWWYLSNVSTSEQFLSVAISANGEYVTVGNNSGLLTSPISDSIYYFGNGTTRSGQQPSGSYNWTSVYFGGPGRSVDRGSIDISANGQYVVVGGTGFSVYYFSNCTSRSGIHQLWDWVDNHSYYEVTTVDMSPDGNYIAVGGHGIINSSPAGFVAFFVNASNAHHQWKWSNDTLDGVFGVEVSDDGYAVAAVSVGSAGTLYYWANAPSFSGFLPTSATWTRHHDFTSVDMSSDGNNVVAGYEQLDIASLHYWNNAKTRTGTDEPETWIDLQTLDVWDVAISNDGGIISATAFNETSSQAEVYFFTSDNTFIASFPLLSRDDRFLSMSGNGQVVAVGGGTFDSLSVYSQQGVQPAAPVGGYDTAPNYLLVVLGFLGSWIAAAVIAFAGVLAVAVVLIKSRKHEDESEAKAR
jgi:hypothetical protein